MCKTADIALFHLLLAKAVLVLRPDLEARITTGASLFELQPEMRRSFNELVAKLALAEIASEAEPAI